MTASLSPFVYAFFPNDPLNRRELNLTSHYLRKMEVNVTAPEEQQLTSTAGGQRSRDLTSKKAGYTMIVTQVSLELMDPEFYVLETYFVKNAKSFDLWFGWVDDAGRVYRDLKIPVRLTGLKPKITPTGNAMIVDLISDLAAQRGPVTVLNRTLSSTKTFISGGLQAKLAADNAVAEAQKQYYKSSGTRKGPLPQQARNTYYYERISDIVSFICDEAGVESDIDVTPVIPPSPGGSADWFTLRMVNQTPLQFIEELTQYASNSDVLDGLSDNEYFMWVDEGGKLFFKSRKRAEQDSTRPTVKIDYLAENDSNLTDLVEERSATGGKPTVVVDLDIDINMTPFIEEIAGIKTTGRDPTTKTFTGIHIAASNPVSEDQARKILGLDDPRNSTLEWSGKSYQRSATQTSAQVESERLRNNNLFVANNNDNNHNWFVFEDAQTLVDTPDPKYAEQIRRERQGGPGTSISSLDTSDAASRYAQYVSEISERGDASVPPQDAENAISKSDLDSAEKPRGFDGPEDPTATGLFVPQPYYDRRSAIAAKNLYNNVIYKALTINAVLLGDAAIRIQDRCDVNIRIPQKEGREAEGPVKHFASGTYSIQGVSHIIDTSGYTTNIKMVRTSVKNEESDQSGSGSFFDSIFDAIRLVGDPQGSVETSASASIGPGGEGNIPPATGQATNQVYGGEVPVQTGGSGGGDDFSTSESFTLVEGEFLDFSILDPAQFSPVTGAYINEQGQSPVSPDGPNIRSRNTDMFDPNAALPGSNKTRRVDIFSLKGKDNDK